MSICALPPVVRIYEDFDKMSAEDLRYCESEKESNRSDLVVIKKVYPASEKEYCSSSCDEESPKCSRSNVGCTTARDDEKPKRTRKLSDGRKKSSSNLFYKCSKSFADTHLQSTNQKKGVDDVRSRATSSSRRHLDPHRSPSGGLRKHVLNRRSPSPLNDTRKIISHGYEQYQKSFLEVPLPRDYGYASSDDLSSEWDSDVPELDTSQKASFSLTQSEIESIAQRYKDATRDGAKDLFDKLYLANVPILIFSAGLGDSVKAMLKYFNMLLPNVKVVSNFLKYKDGLLDGYDTANKIHVFNKNESALKGSKEFGLLHDRNNIIVMGDSLGDSGMANGCVSGIDAHILKIGFLNDHVEANLPAYMEAFDIVLMDDQTMHVPRNIVDIIAQV